MQRRIAMDPDNVELTDKHSPVHPFAVGNVITTLSVKSQGASLAAGGQLAIELVEMILESCVRSMEDDQHSLKSEAKRQWLTLSETCKVFRDTLYSRPHPFQIFAVHYNGPDEGAHQRLEKWIMIIERMSRVKHFNVSLELSFASGGHWHRYCTVDQIQSVLHCLNSECLSGALEMLSMSLASDRYPELEFPRLRNLVRLNVWMRCGGARGPEHSPAFVIDSPTI